MTRSTVMVSRLCASLAICVVWSGVGGAQEQASSDADETRGVSLVPVSSEQEQRGYARRHALVIGIDEYDDPGYPDLGYAVADAQAIAKVLVELIRTNPRVRGELCDCACQCPNLVVQY